MIQINKKILTIICTKNPNEYLINCIDNIINFYPTSDIVIIDSDSNKLETYLIINEKYKNVKICMISNKYYEMGAWNYGYKQFNNYDIYICIQDSIIINNYINLDIIDDNTGYIIKNNTGFIYHIEIKPYALELIKNTKYINYVDINDNFNMAQHSSFIVSNNRLKHLLSSLPNLSTLKIGSNSYERILGIYFLMENIKTIDITNKITKYNLNRK